MFTRFAFAGAALLLTTAAANAASLTSVGGSWTSASAEGGSVYDLGGVGSDRIIWGNPTRGTGPSGYGFAGADTPLDDITQGTRFSLGTFTHYNNAIATTGSRTKGQQASIDSAQLRVDYSLNFEGEARSYSSTFDFAHDETRNQDAVCANGANGTGINAGGCADKVTLLRNDSLSDTFRIGDRLYTLDITGLGIDDAIWTAEGKQTSAGLTGVFTYVGDVAPIPLPAGGALLLGALGGLGLLRRRKTA
ncbi:THxN family PEP-CTERM protein [Pseudoroseicyclus aestuarii]|uniref:Putative secreted protein n=1 Tax=Pseudoroseicyclus aestuarii TaxID=1795041 RepID=A0A318SSN0_9RHOB|nr:THxN family PEP-CTERM protein [Pseudoroseicyclus aestuarii]PYE84542.1 putative secreted protein [Pseudoroseicyclus aestuarii]